MYCRQCGAKIAGDSLFCQVCGKKVKKHKAIQPGKDKKVTSSNKLILILSIIIPIMLISITFGVLGILGVFSKDEIKEVAEEIEVAIEDIPELTVGSTISIEEAEVYISLETQDSQPDIAISEVTESLPPLPENVATVGKAYEITSEGELTSPVLITLSYNPSDLSQDANEENLYIATLVDGSWEAVEGGFVDTANNTVNVSVEHFSKWWILEDAANAVYDTMEVVQNTVYDTVEDVQDIIDQETEKEILAYYQLPIDIQKDLNTENIEPQHIPTVVSIKISVANKAESLVRSAIKTFSPLISKTAGLALAPLETYKNILVDTVTQTIGSSNVDYLEDKSGELVFTIYRVTEKEYEIADTFADTYVYPYTGDPNKWVANATAWVLNTQLSCLNESMPGAFEDIWNFNPLSTSRLHIYAVYIEVYPYKFTDSALLTAIKSIFPTMDTESIAAKGVRFYYYDGKQDRMINYYNNIEYWQVSFDLLEEIISEIEEVLEIETSEAEEETAAQIEPTEGKIVYISSNEIYVMNADGSGQMRLTNNSARERWPVWSPDGKKIAFESDRDGNWEIYVMNADGTGQVNLTNNSDVDYDPSWSPDGKKIAFWSTRGGEPDQAFDEIYVMNADGTNPVSLSPPFVTKFPSDRSPDWSPDGKKIAFSSYRDANKDGNWEIYVMNADGTGTVRLTSDIAPDCDPAWSPDGKKIAFAKKLDDNWEIYIMNANGSGLTNLTNNPAHDSCPRWLPDEQKIVFYSDRDDKFYWYSINADGSGLENLSYIPGGSPDWSK